MAKVSAVPGMLIVEQFDKQQKRTEGGSPYSHVVISNNLGTVRYSGSELFVPDQKIYFGSQYERLIVEGAEVMAMKTENVIAYVND